MIFPPFQEWRARERFEWAQAKWHLEIFKYFGISKSETYLSQKCNVKAHSHKS